MNLSFFQFCPTLFIPTVIKTVSIHLQYRYNNKKTSDENKKKKKYQLGDY